MIKCTTITGLLIASVIFGGLGIGSLIILPLGITFLILSIILFIIGAIGLFTYLIKNQYPLSGFCKLNILLCFIIIGLIIGWSVKYLSG